MPGSIRIFKIAGIGIEINLSWLIILVLLTASLAVDWFPSAAPRYPVLVYWLLGLIAALLLFASVLVHELSHSLVAKARGLPVKSITLFIFGGVSDIEREPQSPGIEFQMAFAGPLTSLIIGAVSLALALLVGDTVPLATATLLYLGVANLLLGVFNLIPGFPLDGGRVLRSAIWKATGSLRAATVWAARVGQGFAYLLILFGVWRFFTGDIINGLWFGFIGWFLLQAAQAENTQVALESLFKGVTVSQLMTAAPAGAQGETSVQQLVDGYVLPYGLRSIPVMRGNAFIGLITLEDVRRVPRDMWPFTPVSNAMTPLARLHIARPYESLNDALPRMAGRDVNQLPVVDEAGQLIGMLSRDAVMRYVEIRRGLGLTGMDRGETGWQGAQRPPEREPRLPVTG
ncbi:MAG TPA: site-2 protease family protein [Ktedonobacterales bacterium]|nr:site-2 protease family protein [Ktedonobacterales bacterium]